MCSLYVYYNQYYFSIEFCNEVCKAQLAQGCLESRVFSITYTYSDQIGNIFAFVGSLNFFFIFYFQYIREEKRNLLYQERCSVYRPQCSVHFPAIAGMSMGQSCLYCICPCKRDFRKSVFSSSDTAAFLPSFQSLLTSVLLAW